MQPNEQGFYVVDGQNYIGDFFAYEIDFDTAGANNNLAATAVAQGSFQVQSQQLFLWTQAVYWADILHAAETDSTRVVPLISVLLNDAGSGKNLTNTAVPVPSIFGTAQLPYILPTPRLCRSLTTISAAVTNFSAATAYNLRLTFLGLALYLQG